MMICILNLNVPRFFDRIPGPLCFRLASNLINWNWSSFSFLSDMRAVVLILILYAHRCNVELSVVAKKISRTDMRQIHGARSKILQLEYQLCRSPFKCLIWKFTEKLLILKGTWIIWVLFIDTKDTKMTLWYSSAEVSVPRPVPIPPLRISQYIGAVYRKREFVGTIPCKAS